MSAVSAVCWFCRRAATKVVTRTDPKYPDILCADCAAVAVEYAREDCRPIYVRELAELPWCIPPFAPIRGGS